MPSWNHDGTQDPGPPPAMPDPLSGLVTGGRYESEPVRVRVVEPAAPDIEAVRTAMASVLDEDSELMLGVSGPAAEPAEAPAEKPGANDPDAGDGGADVGPAKETAEDKADPSTPPVGIPVPPPRQVTPGQIEVPQRRGWGRDRPPRPATGRSWSPGLAAVGVLLLVVAVLVIVMLASLIDTIASVFN